MGKAAFLLAGATAVLIFGQTRTLPRTPDGQPDFQGDVEAQRAATKKLGFLVGEASALRGPGQFVELTQTESAQFKLDGLVPVIEGVGRTKADADW